MLTALARHLALPKSTASVVVKDLERRGFVERARDARDERRLAIVLSAEGRARVADDTVLEPDALLVRWHCWTPSNERSCCSPSRRSRTQGNASRKVREDLCRCC